VVEAPISSLSSARGGEDWSLIVSWPLDKRLAPLTALGRRMLVLYLFLGGSALWFLNRTFDDSITRPLRKLAEQARAYAADDFNQPPVPLNDATELQELGKALNALGENLAKNNPPPANGDAS
jgi:HAMP domain-containing protein